MARGETQGAPSGEGAEARGFFTLGREIFNSLLGFRDVLQTAGVAYKVLKTVEIQRFIDKDLKSCSTECDGIGDWSIRRVENHAVNRTTRAATRLIRQLDHHAAMENVFLLGLVSQFDAFVGLLIREPAIHKPHIVLNSEKSYTAAEIMKFGDISKFQEAVLERETESVLGSGPINRSNVNGRFHRQRTLGKFGARTELRTNRTLRQFPATGGFAD